MKRKEIIETRTGLQLKELSKGAKHEVGKTYYCGYWRQTYEVIDLKNNTGDWRDLSVTCKWQDGHTNSHCTALDIKQDFEVIR
ncbi:hypothetical protein [Tissierella sp.]|uniref:hypothetical protein n=1 Tax=Tissierella sp. TaxID=41274 RepID=UPI00285A7B31|nr:hypothetical protein [Tissierella sp.]MDR7856113.1 hypothetical protein [Tissierella sp.]